MAARHTTLVPGVPVFGDVLFDDGFVRDHAEKMEQAYELMADDLSRRVFQNVLAFYYTGKLIRGALCMLATAIIMVV